MAAIWDDREVHFNINPKKLRLRRGETVIDAWMNVIVLEKFGGGFQEYNGRLVITDLRVTWQMHATRWLNIIVGHHCITNITTGTCVSKFTGTVKEIKIRAKTIAHTPYLLSFVPNKNVFSQMFDTLCAVQMAFNSSKTYRNLILRGAVTLEDYQLKPLPREQIYTEIDGCWNLSSNLGNLGTLYITNIRIVWVSKTNQYYNGSIPYIRMKKVEELFTKYGFTMTVRMSKPYSDLVFAFQVHPEEKLSAIGTEIRAMAATAKENPITGVFVESRPDMQVLEFPINLTEEDTDIDESAKLNFLNLKSLEESTAKRKSGVPVFSKQLGIAVETLPDGFTIESLWKVL